ENAAVPRDQSSHILRADVTLDHADGKIAELSAYAHDQSTQDQLPRTKFRKRKPQQPGQNHRNRERTKRAFPGFVGTDFTAQPVTSEKTAEGESRHVAQLRGEDYVKEIAVGVDGIREKSEVPEH